MTRMLHTESKFNVVSVKYPFFGSPYITNLYLPHLVSIISVLQVADCKYTDDCTYFVVQYRASNSNVRFVSLCELRSTVCFIKDVSHLSKCYSNVAERKCRLGSNCITLLM